MPTSYDPMLTDPPIIFPGDAIPRPSSPMPQTPVCLPCNPPVEPPPDDEVAKVRKMLNAQKASRKKDHNFTDEEIMEANDLRLMKLGRRGGCHNRREGEGSENYVERERCGGLK
mmetsp:Transcript_17244/g.26214  ORF Transcript_17244/g.26214 Transcript_17244/m.26214 type:complete len:114 (+) Transcript_17244:97-438(+)